MADTIPDPGWTFDEALIVDAAIKLSADLDERFRSDAVLDSARKKLWESSMTLHRRDPEVYEQARSRFEMRRRFESG